MFCDLFHTSLFQSFSLSPSENTCILPSKGSRDKVKPSQVNAKVILVQWGVGGGHWGWGGEGGEAILTIQSIYSKKATTKTILILVEGYGVI